MDSEYINHVVGIGATYRLVVPRFTGGFSISCSMLIIYMIFRSNTRLNSIYHRIIFGMSIADIITSTAVVISHLAVPREGISEAVDALYLGCNQRLGNFFTCNIQGFFFFLGISMSHIYTGSLCWFYYCVVVKTMRDITIRKKIEPFLHGVPFGLALILCILTLALDCFNPGISWCAPGE